MKKILLIFLIASNCQYLMGMLSIASRSFSPTKSELKAIIAEQSEKLENERVARRCLEKKFITQQSQIAAILTRLQGVEKSTEASADAISILEDDVKEATDRVENLEDAHEKSIKKIDDFADEFYHMGTRIDGTESRVDDVESAIDDVQTTLRSSPFQTSKAARRSPSPSPRARSPYGSSPDTQHPFKPNFGTSSPGQRIYSQYDPLTSLAETTSPTKSSGGIADAFSSAGKRNFESSAFSSTLIGDMIASFNKKKTRR